MNWFLLAVVLWTALLLGGWLLVGRSLGRSILYLRDTEAHESSDTQETPSHPQSAPSSTH